VTREAARFFLDRENEGVLRRLAPSQWGGIETILLRAGTDVQQKLADYLEHQQSKAAARGDANAAAAYARLRQIPEKLEALVEEGFSDFITAGEMQWGEAFSEAACVCELQRAALRHFWFSLSRLARIHEGALPVSILEDLRRCLHD